MIRALTLSLLLLSPLACAPEAESDDPSPEQLVGQAMLDCVGGGADDAIVRLDSLLALGPVADGYAVRAACYRQRYSKDSARTDAEAALADLNRALEDASGEVTPSDLYSQRAFVRYALAPDSLESVMDDFDRAVVLDSGGFRFRLDRSAAFALLGDTTRAVADLDTVLATPSLDSTAEATVRQRLQALR